MSYPRYQRARDFKFLRHTASLTLNNTSWTNFPTISTLTLAAQVGDTIEVAFCCYHDGAAVSAQIDAVTEVSSTPVNSFATGTTAPTSTTGVGVAGWLCDSGDDGISAGSAFYTLVSSDLSSGTVTIRMRYRTSGATNKVLDVAGGNIFVAVKNLGPPDPN